MSWDINSDDVLEFYNGNKDPEFGFYGKQAGKIGFQGDHGAYSEQAARQYFGSQADTFPCNSFEQLFLSVKTEEI